MPWVLRDILSPMHCYCRRVVSCQSSPNLLILPSEEEMYVCFARQLVYMSRSQTAPIV